MLPTFQDKESGVCKLSKFPKLSRKMAPEKDIYFKLLRKLESSSSLGISTTPEQSELKEESAKQLTTLTNELKKPLIFLRSFGNNPLIFTKEKCLNSEYTRFDYKARHWITIYSFLAQVSYMCALVLLVYRFVRGDYQASTIPGSIRNWKAKHSTTLTDILIKVFTTSFFITCCGGCASSFCMSRKLTTFLNNWKDIVFQFAHTFKGARMDFCSVRCRSTRSKILTWSLSIAFATMAFFFYSPCLFNISGKCTWLEKEQSMIFAFFGSATVLNTTFEYNKFFIFVYTVLDSFAQIKKTLSKRKNCFEEDRLNLQDLFSLVYKVRSQCKLLMKICETTQSYILFFLFVLTIIIWMLIMQMVAGDVDSPIATMLITVSWMQYLRFFVMSYICESICIEEKRIVDEVSEIQPSTMRNQIELQIFVNVLTTKPCEFYLHNSITFRRSLILALFSNTTTYLIAILQLVDASDFSLGNPSTQSTPTMTTTSNTQALLPDNNNGTNLGSIEITFN